jgi:hypothetical protein
MAVMRAHLQASRGWAIPADTLALLECALLTLKSRGLAFPHFGKADFPIEALAPQLASWADALENGRGFVLLRGLPVARYSEDDSLSPIFSVRDGKRTVATPT